MIENYSILPKLGSRFFLNSVLLIMFCSSEHEWVVEDIYYAGS